MKFSQPATRVLGAVAGTALLGAAAVAVISGTASHASHAPAATLAALSHTGAASGRAPKRAQSARALKALALRRAQSARASKRAASPATPAPEGRVVSTGIQTAAGEVVIYGIRVHLRELPGTTFGIMAALRDASGKLTPEITTNETTGSDTATGFHAAEAPMTTGTPARWSANPRVVIFWFTPAADPGGAPLHDLAAYNKTGRHITSGHAANAGHSGRG
jgi:hypothetical protein